jgi:ribonuclease T2
MLSLLSLLAILGTSPLANAWASDNHTCAILPRYYSCETPVLNALQKGYDTCCTPTEGLVLVTQFWNTHTGLEAQGSRLPKEAWGIHGLWPDRCDGTYGQYCDLDRQ